MNPRPPPFLPDPLSWEERALIAGYLLHHRRGTLQALGVMEGPLPADAAAWQDRTGQYYRDAESYSRFLLYWIGYPVGKDQMYVP